LRRGGKEKSRRRFCGNKQRGPAGACARQGGLDLLQVCDELGSTLITVIGIFGHRFKEDGVNRRRQSRIDLAGDRYRVIDVLELATATSAW